MPCRSGYEDEARVVYKQNPADAKLLKDNDHLTHENDQLREALLLILDDRSYTPPDSTVKLIRKNQIAHRKEDLARLKKTFTKSKDAEKLGLVMLADPNKPLEDQLGFSPDVY